MTTLTLHPTAVRVLHEIDQFWQRHGYAPSMREIQRSAGLSSPSVADYWVKHLTERGLVRRAPNRNRTVRLAPGVHVITPEGVTA